MPLNGIERKREYRRVIRAFGNQCFCCGITAKDYGRKFFLHEAIYARPIQTMNLRPICRSCNAKHEYSKDIILASQAIPIGITISQRNKMEFEKWLDGELELNNYSLDRQFIIYNSAHDIGRKLYGVPISSVTTKRYLNEFITERNQKYTYSSETGKIYKKGYSPEERMAQIEQIEKEKQGRIGNYPN